MSIYSRARRHINMERVKEIREEKILEEEIAELIRQQEQIIAEIKKIKHIDWRKELEEGMTSSAMFLSTLPAEGDDTVISSYEISSSDTSLTQNAERSGSNVIFQQGNFNDGDATIVGGSITHLRSFKTGSIDASKSSHVTVKVTKPSHPLGASFESWQDRTPAENFDDSISVTAVANGDVIGSIYLTQNLQDGTTRFLLPKNFRVSNLELQFSQFGLMRGSGDSENLQGTQNPTFFDVTTQRKIPINVFVGLDEPDAAAFLRDGQVDSLSPGEKKKKLEEQLASSKEYLNKMFGEGMPNTATTIADYEPQQSFADVKVSLSPEDLKAISDRVGGSYSGGKVDQKIAASYPKRDPLDKLLKDIDDADKKIPPVNDPNPPNRRGMGDRWKGAQGDSDMEIAGLRPDGTQGFNNPGDEVYDPATKKKYKLVPRKGYGYNQWVPIEKAGRGDTMVAHHELEGEVIVEKKRLKSPKDLVDKIPGYYDGKPAPLGFPIVEPPKMKNGMHPDLVDGKKTAKRFNRLDPVSAKAMPKTGNSYIDKKVKSAAKKPK